jgi:hypothetical protein
LRLNEHLRAGPKKGTKAGETRDNYSTFLARIDQAAESLTYRKDSLTTSMLVVTELYKHSSVGLNLWARRRVFVEGLRSTESSTRNDAFDELKAVSHKMESMFRERTLRLEEKIEALCSRHSEIQASLLDLETSRMKLHSSRMLSMERENLNRAVGEPTGGLALGSLVMSDVGLNEDLQKARGAIILAEALLEVKGT